MTTIERRIESVPVKYRGQYLRVVDGDRKPPPRLAIRVMCMECIGWERRAVTECTARSCPLFRLRPYQSANPLKKGRLRRASASEGTRPPSDAPEGSDAPEATETAVGRGVV